MAIVNNESLVKFGYGVASKAVPTAGHITFASDTRQLFVGDGDKAVAFAGNVANAVFAEKKLTITYNDGTPSAVLDFSDVASAEGVSSLLGGLRKDVNANATNISANATAIENLSTTVANLDTSYKAADASLSNRITSLETAVGEGGNVDERIEEAIETLDSSLKTYVDGLDASVREDFAAADASLSERIAKFETGDNSVATQISNAIDALGGSETGVDASGFVTVKVDTADGQVSSVTVTGKDIASAAELTRVAGRIDTFLDSEDVSGTVDTLHEIQEWMNGEGVNATELTEAIAAEAKLRGEADTLIRTDFAAADATTLASAKSYVDGKVDGKFDASGAAASALESAKSYSDGNLATAKTYAENQASAAQTAATNAAATDATNKADTAETNAKAYADAIKVNGQAQSGQNITVSGLNILVGGTGNHKDASLSTTVEDLYTKVDAASKAGVQSLAVDTNSSNYAEVDKASGAVTLKIKKVALADASATNTGVADAWDVKESIRVAKEGAISTVQGAEGDASTAATVAGAKKYAKEYADAQIEANALRWTVLS